jgi:phosphoribosyl-dephospho-CoA transferase
MFARHDLVVISEHGWQRARDSAPPQCRDIIDLWRESHWPAIVRRADADLLPDQLSIGIAMPPSPVDGSKMRIGLRVAQTEVQKVLPPLPVADVLSAAPEPWRPLLAALEREAGAARLKVRVYGSLALQALTRQPYLTAASDIDILLRPVTPAQLRYGLRLLDSYADALPLDGEIVFPQGQAVAWKEFSRALGATSGTRVLVKEMHRVYLATTSALMASMKDDVCMSR